MPLKNFLELVRPPYFNDQYGMGLLRSIRDISFVNHHYFIAVSLYIDIT